jgi:hypothetical protein
MGDHPSAGTSAWTISGGPASSSGNRAIAALKWLEVTWAWPAAASRNASMRKYAAGSSVLRAELADLLLIIPAGLTRGQLGFAVPHAVADAPAPLAVDQHHEPAESSLLFERRHDGITDHR